MSFNDMPEGYKWVGDDYFDDKGKHRGGIWIANAGWWVAHVNGIHQCHQLTDRDHAVRHMQFTVNWREFKRKERSERQKAYRTRIKAVA